MNKFETTVPTSEEEKLKKFEVTWQDGTTDVLEGLDIRDAFYRTGSHSGAFDDIKTWEEIEEDKEKE